jgi:hypothetical protein
MSQIEASDDADLYSYLGMAELNQPQPVVEDPLLSQGGPTVWDAEAFVDFFRAKDTEGSQGEGYSVVAEDFRQELEGLISRIADARANETDIFPENIRLPIMPVQRAGKIESSPIMKDKYESPGYRAYLGQIEFMLRLRLVTSQAEPGGASRTLSVGRYYDKHSEAFQVYLLEAKSLENGVLRTELFLRTHPPSDMVPRLDTVNNDEGTFFTSGAEETAVLDFYREMDFVDRRAVPTHEDLEANGLPPPPAEAGKAPDDPVDVIKALVYHLQRAA